MKYIQKITILTLLLLLFTGCHWIIAYLASGSNDKVEEKDMSVDVEWHEGHCDYDKRHWCYNGTEQCCNGCRRKCPPPKP